jgi:aspartate/methionine/tyrosine aminotransferase
MVSERARDTTPFLAMDVFRRANERDDVVHLEVGEPDFEPPDHVIEAAVDGLRSGDTGYTEAAGKRSLREAIAAYYDRSYGVDVSPDRILVTPGSSPGLLLACLATLNPGDEALLTDPHYACYPNFIRQTGASLRTVGLDPTEGFALRPDRFAAALERDPAMLLLNSPANPTGAVMDGTTLSEVTELAAARGTTVVADEIYHGLDYDVEAHSVLEYTDEAFVTDGFSKRYGMTGWRLGWVVVPEAYVDAVTRLAQNLFICAPSFVQTAGRVALERDDGHLAHVRETFRERRDVLVDAVADWGHGLSLEYTPGGAYYLLVDVSGLPGDAFDTADWFLDDAGVATTPGLDFGPAAEDYLRLSYATSLSDLEAADRRISALLAEAGR